MANTENKPQPSGTRRWFGIVALVITARVAVGGLTVGGVEIAQIDLMGAAALIGAFGAVYCARRGTDAWQQKK